ncbi:hypothetical protein SAMN05421812_12818 [Asanoa hainanensis]|uniref:Uncharacterized protein n=1 Tax=Asanoa hainanensis TaxID=560556 RepID=A0A239PFS3_9ACTN|nr:hypothetical protein [Asanoa hainanensis]SNT65872.1 hypothetical protein SAMN05421812_12818 [Asanoa hainanensis]
MVEPRWRQRLSWKYLTSAPDGEDEAPRSTDDLRLQTAVRALLALSVIMAITATLDEFGVNKVVRFVVSSVLCGLAFDRLRVWHRGKRT